MSKNIVSRSFHANIITEICLTPSGSLLFKIKTNLQKLYSIPDAICGVCAVAEMHSCLKSELSLDQFFCAGDFHSIPLNYNVQVITSVIGIINF